ncbi:paar repeat-containing protein [Paraburkholderia sp. JPY432]|nr:paar repeat-containing protein [Paraburkholderia youngii]
MKDPNVKAFIYSIGDAEGGDYHLKYGGIKGKVHDKWTFSDYSTHPGAGYDGHTTAAGRYQINIDTWREMSEKNGLKDFSPHTQDILAIEILRSIGVIGSVKSGDIETALSAASRRWAALPQGKGLPGRYKQPYATYEAFSLSYKNYGGTID